MISNPAVNWKRPLSLKRAKCVRFGGMGTRQYGALNSHPSPQRWAGWPQLEGVLRKLAAPEPFRTDPRVDRTGWNKGTGVGWPGGKDQDLCFLLRLSQSRPVDSHVPFGEGLTGRILLEDKQGVLHSGTHQGNGDRSVDMEDFRHSVSPTRERAWFHDSLEPKIIKCISNSQELKYRHPKRF